MLFSPSYREIKAVQFTDDKSVKDMEALGEVFSQNHSYANGELRCYMVDGASRVDPSEWVLVDGDRIAIMSDKTFRATYTPVIK